MTEERIIRNPSPEEIQATLDEASVAGAAGVKPALKKVKPVAAGDFKFRCEMKDGYNPFEPHPVECVLPTKNKVYNGPGITQDGCIYMRRLTTKEEALIQNAVYRDAQDTKTGDGMSINDFLHVLNSALDSCIKSAVNINDIAIIDKIPLIVKLISISYGKKLEVTFMCTECGAEEKVTIDLEKDVIINYITDKFESPKRIAFKCFDFPVEADLVIPTIEYEDAYGGNSLDVIRQFESLIANVYGTKPDGEPITNRDKGLIIENLDSVDKDLIKKYVDEFSVFGSDLNLKPIVVCHNVKGKCSLAEQKVSPNLELRHLLNKLLV